MSDSETTGSAIATPEDLLGIGSGDDILVVDDNEANLVAFEAALAPLGRKVVAVRSGVEALAKLLHQEFAIVILDVSMPGMTGLECAKLVRERERTRGLPIIFITGMSVQDQGILDGYEVGGYDFLIKPIRAELLRAKVRVFLKLQERTRELHQQLAVRQELELAAHKHKLREQTQRHQAEVLGMRVHQLAEINRRKDELLAVLGHQLRNPLQALQLAIDMLHMQTDVQPESIDRLHSIIEQRVRLLSQLVDDLLDIAKLSTGEIEIEKQPVKLADVVRDVVMGRMSEISARTIDLMLDDSVIVNGDAKRLTRCVHNLLDNALKFTDRGGRIQIAIKKVGERARLHIIDNGRGIPPELLPQVFDVFARADGTAGLGLGLAIVRRLIEVHGGIVWALSSGKDRGAKFEIELAPTHTALLDVVRPARPLRVVVCEDSHDIRELTAHLLRADGHTVYEAANGLAAIALIETERPDVALVDLVLPDIDGFTVARTVRSRLGSVAPRLVAITAMSNPLSPMDFDEYVLKPASRERMLSVLARVSR